MDGGTSWTTCRVPSATGLAEALAVNPNDENTIYLGGYDSNYNAALYKTINGGAGWTKITGSIRGTIYVLAIDPKAVNRVYVGTNSGLFRSENGGASWVQVFNNGVPAIQVNPKSPNEVFIASWTGVSVSQDYGATWTEINTGLAHTSDIKAMAFNPTNRILYVGTGGGSVYKKIL